MFGRGVKLCDSVVTTCALSMLGKLSKLVACHTRFCNILQGMLTELLCGATRGCPRPDLPRSDMAILDR